MLLGVDTGGTFTDFVLLAEGQLRHHKVLSTPHAPEQAILQGIRELGLEPALADGRLRIVHGSTVATNAALERKGVRTVFITNRGFADLLTIGRQARHALYDLAATPPAPPVPSALCLETGGRLDASGELVEPLTDEDLATLRSAVQALAPEAVAINLLFSFLDERLEERIAKAMPAEIFTSRSSAVLPEYREYERGIATWLNAWLGPLMQRYLQRLSAGLGTASLSILQSSGGRLSAEAAGQRAVHLLLSGPAGGLSAARCLAETLAIENLLTFDMGGTSTDVAMIHHQRIELTTEGRIGPWPVAVPMVDMHTIGAGGGSIASVDDGGLLHVGPASAGARPGPACYGAGGTQATVTDAHAVLGRLPAASLLGGSVPLDIPAARVAIGRIATSLGCTVEDAALGIVQLANEHMARALRVISVQRGHDPRRAHLCCFGGAGGLHVCELADALGIQQAIVPALGGVFSAWGMITAPRARQLSRSLPSVPAAEVDALVAAHLHALREQGLAELAAEGVARDDIRQHALVEMRYCGQGWSLALPWQGLELTTQAFHETHRACYGHALERPVEAVTIRLQLDANDVVPALPEAGYRASTPHLQTVYGIETPVPVHDRTSLHPGDTLHGPCLVTETTATLWVAPGWQLLRDHHDHLHLQRRS